MGRKRYKIGYTRDARADIAALDAGQRAQVLKRTPVQLEHRPTVEARNRKRTDPDKRFYVTPWELRIGELRVYYSVQEEPKPLVLVLSVGIKDGDRVKIRGKYLQP